MPELNAFIKQLQFDFRKDFVPVRIAFDSNKTLTARLLNKVYRYVPPSANTKTAITFIDATLTGQEQVEIHNFLWNEHKSDLYCFLQNSKLVLNYTYTYKEDRVLIDEFSLDQINEAKDKINKRNFDTGFFWEVYVDKLNLIKRKRKTVDQGLIQTLRQLRKLLQEQYSRIVESNGIDEIVQALIDRTLFIKFLEDKHILNEAFYCKYFSDVGFCYKELLKSGKKEAINSLYDAINGIFNNSLFTTPRIPNKLLLHTVLVTIAEALERKDFQSGQLSLFDYRFDIMPTEFIGHVYEMFFDEKQATEGIYYTPEGVAKIIVDTVIQNEGSVLDPACGSGMFLVTALRKLYHLKNINNHHSINNIKERLAILDKNIYGIEKQENARRLTILSLYLEVLNGISPVEISKFISEQLKAEKPLKLFPIDFSKNIVKGNALSISSINNKEHFDYVIGNPPFHQIKEGEEEEVFWKMHKKSITKRQISQCFFIKIKDFSSDATKFGFISNLSNFDSENSVSFQNFFFRNYRLTKFFNLADIKNILFDNAKESTCVLIFDNELTKKNHIKYLAPELSSFAKNFKVVLLKEGATRIIDQDKLVNGNDNLRNYFVGSPADLELANNLSNFDKLYKYLIPKNNYDGQVYNGIQFIGSENVQQVLGLENWDILSRQEKEIKKREFISKFISHNRTNEQPFEYVEPRNIAAFILKDIDTYLPELGATHKGAFERIRSSESFTGNKILIPRVGKLKAAAVEKFLYYSFDVYAIKPKKKEHLYLFTALLNSRLIDYYVLIKHKKRATDSYPKITMDDLSNMPVPFDLDSKKILPIVSLCKEISSGKCSYQLRKNELDELIFNLYGLDAVSRTRVLDFFTLSGAVSKEDLQVYCKTYIQILSSHLPENIKIEEAIYIDNRLRSSLVGVKFSFTKTNSPNEMSIEKIVEYNLVEIIKEIGNRDVYSLTDRLYSENCVYIVRENDRRKWTATTAIEDAKHFLTKIL